MTWKLTTPSPRLPGKVVVMRDEERRVVATVTLLRRRALVDFTVENDPNRPHGRTLRARAAALRSHADILDFLARAAPSVFTHVEVIEYSSGLELRGEASGHVLSAVFGQDWGPFVL